MLNLNGSIWGDAKDKLSLGMKVEDIGEVVS